MKNNKMVGSPDLTPDWFKKYKGITDEIKKQLFRGLREPGKGLTLNHLQLVVEHKNPFAVADYSDLLVAQQNFYRDIFKIQTDFSSLRITERQPGFDRLIIVAQGMMPQQLYDKCREFFPCYKWTDKSLDEVIDFSFQTRSAKNGAYAIWIRDRVEADEELKNLSANDLKKQNITGITLEERLIYELKYFKETGKHLDINNWTLCSGSRCSVGGVPRVSWFGSKLNVSWCVPGNANPDLRSRQVVS